MARLRDRIQYLRSYLDDLAIARVKWRLFKRYALGNILLIVNTVTRLTTSRDTRPNTKSFYEGRGLRVGSA
jgi:hypothetical protein